MQELADEYEAAWDEWMESGDAAAWESVIADGLTSGFELPLHVHESGSRA